MFDRGKIHLLKMVNDDQSKILLVFDDDDRIVIAQLRWYRDFE